MNGGQNGGQNGTPNGGQNGTPNGNATGDDDAGSAGNMDAGTNGNPDAGNGSADAGNGSADASNGSADAGNGSADAGPADADGDGIPDGTDVCPGFDDDACDHGVCTTGTCVCETGFTGTYCDACESGRFGPTCTSCSNCGDHGACDDGLSGDGSCECDTGFDGAACDSCAAGYYGASCSACPECTNGTACQDGLTGDGSCSCPVGFGGANCADCSADRYGATCAVCDDCGEHGDCNDGISGDGVCACDPGWTGDSCDTCQAGYYGSSCFECSDCSDHGECDDGSDGDGACACDTGFVGDDCETCAPGYYGASCTACPACTNGTICLDGPAGSGACACPPGFGGVNCAECLPGRYGASCGLCQDCGANGECNQGIGGNGACTCDTGFSGGTCNVCAAGYYGASCTACGSCGANGTCADGINGDGSCVCASGFTGAVCNTCLAGFYGASCSACPACDNGVCEDGLAGSGQCDCDLGWGGALCNACADDFYGASCTSCPDCNNGSCNDTLLGNGQCTCQPGWDGGACDVCAEGYYSASCASLCPNCNNGDCNDGLAGNGSCSCDAGWDGANCNTCADGFYGASCNACTCDNGTCADGLAGDGYCDCDPAWAGADCDVCDTGYYGPACERFASCREMHLSLPTLPSGNYVIDTGTGGALNVYCDMNTDDGVGYTMVRFDDAAGLNTDQAAYAAKCAAYGMEVIVPRTRAHFNAIRTFNRGAPPNLINVFPKVNSATSGLQNWEGRCKGQACSFYVSDSTNASCGSGNEPSGDNNTAYRLYLTNATSCENGAWNDASNNMSVADYVICSLNDVGPPTQQSCFDINKKNMVSNVGSGGINGTYTIDPDGTGGNAAISAYCDQTTDRGGWTLVLNYLHQTGTNPVLNARSATLPLLNSSTLGVDESGGQYWGHATPAMISSLGTLGEVRFYGTTSEHARVLHFKTNDASCLSYVGTGTGQVDCSGVATSYTALTGHTANLPASVTTARRNEGDYSLTDRPFYGIGNWWIRGDSGGGTEWAMDGTSLGSNVNSLHRVFVRPASAALASCAAYYAAGYRGSARYPIDPEGDGTYFNAYCDMSYDGGGWTLIMATNGVGPNSLTAGEVVPYSARYMVLANMQAVANLATRVHMRTAGSPTTLAMTSVAGAYPITNLRAGLHLNANSGMYGSTATLAGWTGPYAQVDRLWHSCGIQPYAAPTGYPSLYWACNNGGGPTNGGIHVTQTISKWAYSDASSAIEVYLK